MEARQATRRVGQARSVLLRGLERCWQVRRLPDTDAEREKEATYTMRQTKKEIARRNWDNKELGIIIFALLNLAIPEDALAFADIHLKE